MSWQGPQEPALLIHTPSDPYALKSGSLSSQRTLTPPLKENYPLRETVTDEGTNDKDKCTKEVN